MKMRGKISSVILRIVMYASAGFTAAALLFILGYILAKGIPNLTSPGLFAWEYTSDNVSLVPAAINTLMLVALALVMSIPFGIGSAIYLTEYAKKGNKFVSIIRVTTETLSGIPSIIYGLFGMLFFVTALKWQYSILAGAATVAIMVLPTIMRTTEEALLAVPDSFREASLALGAGKIRTIFKIVLPSAMPGILSGVILAIGRMVGETAALLYTSGAVASVAKGVMSPGRTLAIHMYTISSEAFHTNQTFATAVVLLVIVFILNALASFVAKKLTKK
ncbi:MAG TPA: phosphate ABC transporter permease PstA [Lachnospiraceae bacterium]|jgi:phosphate transport system permease protein|nr:phosphate ABC transporter permease protein PstA [Butyrivibrio sp. CAG:318]HJI30697.1 phosphate ABC transporter permease PstA [Lachnospiraceae bacterium]